MRHPSDVSVQTAFIGHTEDDKRWKAEKKRKHAKKAEPEAAPPGVDCCATCRNWRRPDDADGFGSCQKLVTIVRYAPGCPERGHTASIEEAMNNRLWTGNWEHMRTRAGFLACSRFAALALKADAEAEDSVA